MSRDPTGRASTNQVPDPASRVGADTGVTPDYPPSEDSDNVSVTNTEVESDMNHRRRRAALHEPSITKEAFNAFSAADAYIRAARDGLARATEQYLKDMQVSMHCIDLVTIYQ